MFTGIIQDIGTIRTVRSEGSGKRIVIYSKLVDSEMKLGDSIAISGVCLTAAEIVTREHLVTVTAVQETLSKSTLDKLQSGASVNLELALRASDRLGGHFVQGHVDAIGECRRIADLQGSREMEFEFPREFGELIAEKGSIAIDGVSLTAYNVAESRFTVSIIPHTAEVTAFATMAVGNQVNLEFDILGKYIQKMNNSKTGRRLTTEMLREYGY